MKETLKIGLTTILLFLFASAYVWGNEKPDSKRVGPKKQKSSLKQQQLYTEADVQKERAKAASAIREMDAVQRYTDFLAPSDLNKLPIGFKKKVGNSTIKIAISNAIFTPKHAELTVYAKVEVPQLNAKNAGGEPTDNKSIFFGIKGLKLSKDGGIVGSGRLVLLGDYKLPINGNSSSLVLKGSFDAFTGAVNDKTYIEMDCNGFKEFGIAADVEFSKSLLVPVDIEGNQLNGLVKGSFSTIVSNWNDILATVNLPRFQIKGVSGVSFQVLNAVVDLSDYRNSPDIVYPVGYKEKYLDNSPELINLWRGVYAKEISVTLPPSFKDRTSSAPVSFGTRDMIIDNNGITGLFYAEHVLGLDKGSAGGWQFSVDSFRIALEANRLLRAGFGGRIGLPVNDLGQTNGTIDSSEFNRKYLAYAGIISSSGDYLCRVQSLDSLSFDVWKAKVVLKPNSYIDLAGNQNEFKPSAMLHGSMDIASNTSTTGETRQSNLLDFKGVEFQSLHIKTDAPYLSANYFGYKGSLKLGIIPVTIDNIALVSGYGNNSNEVGLQFSLGVNLQDLSFGGSTHLAVIGKHHQDQGLKKMKYERVEIGAISINAKLGSVSIDGTIEFLDNDPVYGDGFKGGLNLGVGFGSKGVTVEATAIFGNKGYRYWFVDGLVTFQGFGIPVGGGLNLNGFGGGAYYRMKKSGFDNTYSQSGMSYIPDSTAGLGLRAAVVFNVGTDKLTDGKASLEIAFNKNGGMRYMGFFGSLQIMQPINLGGSGILGSVKSMFSNIESQVNGILPSNLEGAISKKILQPTAAAKDMFPDAIATTMGLRAVLGINFDFNNKVFHANFDLYVSTPGNFLTGIGAGGRAGWAVMHVDPQEWYLHMGTPVDPIGIKIALGPLSIQTTSYFMLGHNLPPFPELPAVVRNMLGEPPVNNIDAAQKDSIKTGKGIAFGAGIHIATGDIKFLMLYANLQAGMGFDVMIKDFSDYTCANTGKAPGVNGWYAQGQVYAYVQGDCGIRIKLGPIRKNISILKAGAVAYFTARLPSPTWFAGRVPIKVSVLGGKIKIDVELKFSFGEDCQLVANKGGEGNIDFDEFKVVSAIEVGSSTDKVSLFVRPVVKCMTRPEAPFELPADEGGNADETYRAHISSIKFIQGATSLNTKHQFISNSNDIMLFPEFNLLAQTNYQIKVEIIYQRLISGSWVNVTNADGSPATEVTTTSFKTGNNPPNIPDENIGFMYPFKNQRLFYKNEVTEGKVLITTTRNDLFGSFASWKAVFFNSTTNDSVATTPVTYNAGARTISYPIPASLQNNTGYTLKILGNGNLVDSSLITDPTRPILEFVFKTSQHNTLTDKINSIKNTATPVAGRIESDVIDLQARVAQYEGFELAELVGNAYTGNKPLISALADLAGNYYYEQQIQPLIKYPNFFTSPNLITINREEYETIPIDAITVTSYYLNAANSTTYNSTLFDRLPYAYSLNEVFNIDFIELRNQIINRYMTTNAGGAPNTPLYRTKRDCPIFCKKYQVMNDEWVVYFNSAAYKNAVANSSITNIPPEMRSIVSRPFPFMTKGDYKVNFSLRKVVSWGSGANDLVFENSVPVAFNYHNPIETLYKNDLKFGVFYNNQCGSGATGSAYTYYVQPGTHTSTISAEDANQKALNDVSQNGQWYANMYGKCCHNGECYTPGMVNVNLTSYVNNGYSCNGNFNIVFNKAGGGSFQFSLQANWYGASSYAYVPAGSYTVSITGPYGSYNSSYSYTLNGGSTWSSWGGGPYASTSSSLVLSSDATYTLSVGGSCSQY